MVTSVHKKVLRVAYFPGQKSSDHLYREGATIDEITVEYIGVFRRRAAINLKNVHQIVVLPVNVSTHCDLLKVVNVHFHQCVVLHPDFLSFINQHYSVFLV
jgi:hypothetical protein